MNSKTLLFVSLVLATPACAVSGDQVDEAAQDALEARARAQLGAKSFISNKIVKATRWKEDASGHFVPTEIDVRHRIRFIPTSPENYTYDGTGAMEYEAVVELVEVADPSQVYGVDFTYYVKRSGSSTFRLFDCDSTRRCWDGTDTAKISFFKKNGVEMIRLSGLYTDATSHGVALEALDVAELELELEAPAPAN